MTGLNDIEIAVHCLCKSQTFSVSLPATKLPFAAICCHCNECRRLTGGMYICAIEWPGSPEAIMNSALRRYTLAKNSAILFCGNCGTPVFARKMYENGTPDVFYLPAGLLPNSNLDLVRIAQHFWVEDTLDGGASAYMQNLNGASEPIPRWRKGHGETNGLLDSDWPLQASCQERIANYSSRDSVRIQCLCKGVDFSLRRGHDGFSKLKAQGKLPGWVNPTTLKPVAAYDACDSCRFMVGVPLMHWTFARVGQLCFATGSRDGEFPTNTPDLKAAVQAGKDSRFGTLTFYESSPDVQRYYCSRCSASVFYAAGDLPDQVDISMGLLHAPEGSRAESWVEWEWGRPWAQRQHCRWLARSIWQSDPGRIGSMANFQGVTKGASISVKCCAGAHDQAVMLKIRQRGE